ncbi:RNA degradosome polyphosphate kinase [Bacillus sp. 1NLA3E]|uniref:RNA degradosome polyphosphate kinase n=1 Tax=Bacillus sp. 1NLA3E TaxID=666686 RepID=UPI000327F6BC|nr:RNA degradosome polyphosphate kinase [Bacillus sp. 1NLA3E]AGK54130.1 polyphosphate kinase [Bacillus sp. 1NLA3E]
MAKKLQLDNHIYYNNRELSWLAFNERVLEEAIDPNNPLLERLKFLAIFSSNLDEFFMVRVAGLKDQVQAGFNKPDNKAGLTPKTQLATISMKNHKLVELQYETFSELIPELKGEKIEFVDRIDQLSGELREYLENYFDIHIFPVLTPMAIDAYRPFPMLLNKSLNLAILIEDKEEFADCKEKLAIVQVPAVLDRFILLPTDQEKHMIVMLEDIISYQIEKLFKGHHVKTLTQFRITRNADMTIHEEGARDLLKEIEDELKKRKWGAAVRLEIKSDTCDEKILRYLQDELEVHKKDTYIMNGFLDLTFLFSFYKTFAKEKEHLVYDVMIPKPPQDLSSLENIFDVVSKRDILLHHPYESFEPVIDFVTEAAVDPDVLAIKQTLYRVSGNSPVIKALEKAAEHGKQVTVLVELKARFDEENNVQWAKELEKAGCHVIYGMSSLKTHSKITLVVRRKNNNIQRFVHLGTGNYNDATAKTYTDMGLITSKRKFGIDATNFFNYLSGYTEKPNFHHLSVAPFDIRKDFIQLFSDEIDYHKRYGNGKIVAKMNSLTDKKLIMKFYEASNAGVEVDLIVRGTCCLRPGIKGVSENITVRSIVGRFLEHSRIYYFHQNGEEKIFLSSADMMTRNLDKRVEILFPVFEGLLKKRIKTTLSLLLSDNVKARLQNSIGEYDYVKRLQDQPMIDSQKLLYEMLNVVSEDEE